MADKSLFQVDEATPVGGTEVPELTDGYRKARRNLTFCSAILIFWEYVGVTVTDSTDQTISPLGIKVGFKNPEVVPTILFLTTLYLFFRFYLEWSQVSLERRKHRSAFLDMAITSIITVGAIGLYIFQFLSEARVADLVTEYEGVSYLIVTFLMVIFVYFGGSWRRTPTTHFVRMLAGFEIAMVVAVLFLSLLPLAMSIYRNLTSGGLGP